ncbi:MAG: gliding motility-associated C-terminal domain-containing protein [Bacteroidales bacterium]|nr:gliding motility-associated C-terminal domain-containing protein [Bacteroidales bacterium]
MKNNTFLKIILYTFFSLLSLNSFSQATSLCDNSQMNASPFCTDLNPYGITYSAGTSGYASELYYINTTGCLDAYSGGVNPAWYKMKISTPGTLNIYMAHSGGCDIDYACWGPFTDQDMVNMCAGFPNSLSSYLYDNLPYNNYNYYYYGEQYFSHHPTYVDNNYNSATYGMTWVYDWYSSPSGKLVDCSATPSATEWVHIKNAQAGEWYILLISNWEGCPGNINFTSNQGSTANTDCSITAPVTGDEVCEGSTATLTADAINGAVNYKWSGPNGFSQTTNSNTLTLTNVTLSQAGQYSVQVYNGGSYGSATSCDLIIHPMPTLQVSDISICKDQSGTLTVSGADTYEWNSGSTESNYTVSPTTTTVYTVTGTNAGMCSSTATVTVNVLDSLIIEIIPDTICVGETATVSGPAGLSYLWSDGSTSKTITPLTVNPPIYTVTASTAEGCTGTASVYVMPSPTADFTADSWTVDWENPTVHFTDLSSGATSWSWNFGCPTQTDNTSNIQSPSFTYPYAGYFGVSLEVESENGCKDQAVHQVTVTGQDFQLYIPNSFTPNKNGVNDTWKPIGMGIDTYELIIYDRHGSVMFTTTDFNEGWDGMLNGKTVPLGTYVYRIYVTFVNAEQNIYKGFVNIIR